MTSATPAPSRKRKAAVASSSDEDDDVPLASSQPTVHRSAAVPMPGAAAATTVPRGSLPPLNGKGTLKPAKWDNTETVDDEESSDSDDDVPLAASSVPPTPAKSRTNGKAKAVKDFV